MQITTHPHAPAFQLGVDLDILLQLGAQVGCRHVALIFVEVRGLWWKRRKGRGRPRRRKRVRDHSCVFVGEAAAEAKAVAAP